MQPGLRMLVQFTQLQMRQPLVQQTLERVQLGTQLLYLAMELPHLLAKHRGVRTHQH